MIPVNVILRIDEDHRKVSFPDAKAKWSTRRRRELSHGWCVIFIIILSLSILVPYLNTLD